MLRLAVVGVDITKFSLSRILADTSSELYANLTAFYTHINSAFQRAASRFLSPGMSYTFRVGVTSVWYREEMSEAVARVTVASGSVPSVEILGGHREESHIYPSKALLNYLLSMVDKEMRRLHRSVRFAPQCFFSRCYRC